MRKILSLAAAVASAFAMGSAQAELLLVDNFNFPTTSLADGDTSAANGYATLFGGAMALPSGQIATARMIEQNLLALNLDDTVQMAASVRVGGSPNGNLRIGHDTADSDVRITWDISSFSLPSVQSAILFNVLFSNQGSPTLPVKLQFEFFDSGNVSKWTKEVDVGAIGVGNTPEQFGLLASEATSFAAGGKLQLVLSSNAGWDFAIDEFSISIPEPTSLALVGLALVGAGVASRRRKA